MVQNVKKRMEGFTIIEVMIVLAIAGLIMLIVFLAIPALQRSQRNNARNADASKIAAAVNECLSNRNGATGSCDDANEIGNPALSALSSASWTGTGSTTVARVTYNAGCDSTGQNVTTPGASAKAFAVSYQLESGGTAPISRCIGG